MDVLAATNIAISTPSGSPPYYLAEALCRLRGRDPWAMETPTGLVNWQALIAESILTQALVEMAASAQLHRSVCFPNGAPEPGQRNADDMGMPPR